MRLFIYPYASGSESAKLLAEELDCKRIRLTNSQYSPQEGDVILNWGSSTCPYPSINSAAAVKNVVNKLRFFRLMRQSGNGDIIPAYWTDSRDIPEGAFPVLCRTRLEGCDGAGIVIAHKREDLVDANLYTTVLPNWTEYRVTMYKGAVTDIQTKLPRQGEIAHPLIKTYANGWGFQRVPVPPATKIEIIAAAARAIEAAGLDFAGVDVLYTAHKAVVLEVNTAMGLEGQALKAFAEAVQRDLPVEATQVPEEPVSALSEPENPIQGSSEAILEAVREERWGDVLKMVVGKL